MSRILRSVVLAGVATLAIATGAHAAGNASAKIMLHSLTTTTKNPCTRATNVPAACGGYDNGVSNQTLTSGTPAFHYVYLLVVNGSQVEGIAGVQCGINYNGAEFVGVDVFTWSLCATLEFASTGWPNAGGGNLITWDATTRCQTAGNATIGAVAVAGFFYMGAYTPDVMRVTPRPVDALAKVANCGSVEDIVFSPAGDDAHTFLGAVGFGPGNTGINPCGRELVLPVEPTSWSAVKTLTSTN
ncbi:MAG TPA: hypothetical protein VF720_14610 [Candidatus Eisenbacteria bacterium]